MQWIIVQIYNSTEGSSTMNLLNFISWTLPSSNDMSDIDQDRALATGIRDENIWPDPVLSYMFHEMLSGQ